MNLLMYQNQIYILMDLSIVSWWDIVYKFWCS